MPIGRNWTWKHTTLRPQSLREDRILHEFHATGGDIRRVCDLFGLSITGATRYLKTVEHPDLRSKANGFLEHEHPRRPKPPSTLEFPRETSKFIRTSNPLRASLRWC